MREGLIIIFSLFLLSGPSCSSKSNKDENQFGLVDAGPVPGDSGAERSPTDYTREGQSDSSLAASADVRTIRDSRGNVIDDRSLVVGAFGAFCSLDEECETGYCLSNGRCTRRCESDDDCPPGPEWKCDLFAAEEYLCQCTPSADSETCDGRDNDCDTLVDQAAICQEQGYTCKAGRCICELLDLCGEECPSGKLNDTNNCGSCNHICPSGENAIAECNQGQCHLKCDEGFGDCDADPNNGCETPLNTGDPQNCGACGQTCSTEACDSGVCIVGERGKNGSPWTIMVDSTSVYWTSWINTRGGSASWLMKVDKAGGTTEPIFGGYQFAPGYTMIPPLESSDLLEMSPGELVKYFAVDDDHIYWTNTNGGLVVRMDKSGGQLLPVASLQDCPGEIVVDENSIYWSNLRNECLSFGIGGAGENSTIMKLDKSGNIPVMLASTQSKVTDIVIDETNIYWIEGAYDSDNHSVLEDSGLLFTLSKSGGTPLELLPIPEVATHLSSGQTLAVDQTTLYWIDMTNEKLTAMDKSGGTRQVLTEVQDPTGFVVVDDTNVYWSCYAGRTSASAFYITIMKLNKSGGTPVELVTDTQGVLNVGFAVDESSVYWVNAQGLVKIAK